MVSRHLRVRRGLGACLEPALFELSMRGRFLDRSRLRVGLGVPCQSGAQARDAFASRRCEDGSSFRCRSEIGAVRLECSFGLARCAVVTLGVKVFDHASQQLGIPAALSSLALCQLKAS